MGDLSGRVSLAIRILKALVAVIGVIHAAELSPRAAWAQADPIEAPAPNTEDTSERGAVGTAIDRAHDLISAGITDTADRIDTFLGDERIKEEANQSYLSVAVLRVTDETGMEVNGQIRLKIVLPQLQRRLHLVIAEEDEIAGPLGPDGGDTGIGKLVTKSSRGSVTSALRLMLRATRDFNVYIDGGVRVRTHPTVFTRLRYRTSAEFTHWAARFTQSVKWEEQFAENPYQWEVISRFDVERPIASAFFFRTSLQGTWTEGRHGYVVDQGFSLVQRITLQRVLVYQWNTKAQTGQSVKTENDIDVIVDPDRRFRVVETGFTTRYRQTVWRPWLFFETGPELAFRRDLDQESRFDGVWRFLVKLEVQFRDMGRLLGAASN